MPDHRLFHRFRNPQLRSQDPPVDGNDPLVPDAVGGKQFLFPLLRPDPNGKSPLPLPVIPPDLLQLSFHHLHILLLVRQAVIAGLCIVDAVILVAAGGVVKVKSRLHPTLFTGGDKVCHRIGFPVLIGKTRHGITILLGVL